LKNSFFKNRFRAKGSNINFPSYFIEDLIDFCFTKTLIHELAHFYFDPRIEFPNIKIQFSHQICWVKLIEESLAEAMSIGYIYDLNATSVIENKLFYLPLSYFIIDELDYFKPFEYQGHRSNFGNF